MSDYDGPMTVAKLRELLHDLPGDRLVVLAGDPEGNDFRQLSDSISDDYRWHVEWGELVGDDEEPDDEDPDDDDDEGDSEEDDEPDESVPCIVLWPV